jgi:hypothetical protein
MSVDELWSLYELAVSVLARKISSEQAALEQKLRELGQNIAHPGRMKCLCCEDCSWVCENHPDQPWEGPHACTCGGAGMPCPKCNSSKDEPPRLPKGSETDAD